MLRWRMKPRRRMMPRWSMKRRWWIVLLPIAVGVVLSLILNSGLFPNPIVYLRADLGAVFVLIGVLVAIGLAGWLIAWSRAKPNVEREARWRALEEGADDYLNKPFDPYELIARIRAVLRRARPGQPPLATASLLQCGELKFDRRTRRAYLAAHEITLTPKAVALLEYLLTHPDELLTRERLLEAVWGWDYPAGTRTVDTRIAELRRALNDDVNDPRYIETVPGEGYRFVGKVEVA